MALHSPRIWWRGMNACLGRYCERSLTERTIIREIFVYSGGKTSVHRHRRSTELNIAAGGVVLRLCGDDPECMDEVVLRPGDSLEINPVYSTPWRSVALKTKGHAAIRVTLEIVSRRRTPPTFTGLRRRFPGPQEIADPRISIRLTPVRHRVVGIVR